MYQVMPHVQLTSVDRLDIVYCCNKHVCYAEIVGDGDGGLQNLEYFMEKLYFLMNRKILENALIFGNTSCAMITIVLNF